MRRLFIIPFFIWFGGCSLFVYDAASFGLVGGGTDKSGISASVTVSSNGWFANSHYIVTLTNKDGLQIQYSIDGTTNISIVYSSTLQFSNRAPFPLLARTRVENGTNVVWGSLSSNWIPVADGSGPHPWHIATRTHLSNIRLKLANHYLQVGNINMNEDPMAGDWVSIGQSEGSPFSGSYTGGTSSTKFNITATTFTNIGATGLFGYCQGAGLTNIQINGASVSVNADYVGILCGKASNSTISGCEVEGTVTSAAPGGDFAGGLAGALYDCTVTDCTVSLGSVTGVNNIGGLAGIFSNGSLSDCSVSFGVTGTFNVGGLCGLVAGNASVQSCTYNGGQVTGAENVGGLIGQLSGSASDQPLVNQCSVMDGMTVSGSNCTGGLIGLANNNRGIQGCSANINVEGTNMTGGLIGSISLGFVDNCQSSGFVQGADFVGGLIGNSGVGVTNCRYEGGGVTGSTNVGGLVGYGGGSIFQSGVLSGGSVSAKYHVGGLVGNVPFSCTINQCFSQAPVDCAVSRGGGLIGYCQDTTLNNCYSTGTMEGSGSYLGGLIGNSDGTVTVNTCYAAGGVPDGAPSSGRFIGVRNTGAVVTACYANTNAGALNYLTNLVGNSGDTNGIVGGSTEDMKTDGFYTGWNIGVSSIWAIQDNNSYPYFEWQEGDTIPTSP